MSETEADVLTREEVERIRGYWKDWKFGTPHAVSGCDCDECRERNEVLGLAASHAALRSLLEEARELLAEIATLHQQAEPLGIAVERARTLAERLEAVNGEVDGG